MTTRKEFLSIAGMAGFAALLPEKSFPAASYPETKFRYCLNTSTVSKNPLDIIRYIDIASGAGYDGIEIWIRGGSSFDTLKMIDGSLIEIFHFNDYISSKPRKEQDDSDRVYPGDGAAPFKDIVSRLRMMGGEKVLSLELFNEVYWTNDPLSIANSGLRKLKAVTSM